MTTLKSKNSIVKIDAGELVSFCILGEEYIHQKGNKGWRKSDDEMFPVIGPTVKNNFRIHTRKGDAILDQHGLLRELDYSLVTESEKSATFIKSYASNTKVKNSKFPDKSSEPLLHWPFDFSFEKKFELNDTILTISFTITAEGDMPFMLGYHPAFLLSNSGNEVLTSNTERFDLKNVYKAGANAFPVLNTDKITLHNINKNDIQITTKGFNNFMLWTEVDNMLCIEPITHYTSYSDQNYSEKDMLSVKKNNEFEVAIRIL